MKRSVYSLVLMDDVVEAIDRLAYAKNTSRSNLINQLLAEHVRFVTPEKRMRDIFSQVERMICGEDCFQVQAQPSEAMLAIRSALKYKYNPTVRYSVELYRNGGQSIGELKVSFRTQSRQLIDALNRFFQLWAALEEKYVGGFFPTGIPYGIEDGRYSRKLVLPREAADQSHEALGDAIAWYIRMFDEALKIYFAGLNDLPHTLRKMEKVYAAYQKGNTMIL